MFGATSTSLFKAELDTLSNLAILSSLRGLDSTGVSILSKRKGRFMYDIAKSIYSPGEWIQTKQGRACFESGNGTVSMIGHCRAATIGEITHENAHPFLAGDIIGAHNGTIHSFGQGGKTDSQVLFETINKHGIDDTIQNKVPHGAYALTWYNVNDGTLNFLRNNERTLFYCISDTQTLFWASEASFLDLALSRNNIKRSKEIEAFDVDTLYSIPFGSMNITKREVKKKPFFMQQVEKAKSRFKTKEPGKTTTPDSTSEYPYKNPNSGLFISPTGVVMTRQQWLDYTSKGCSWCTNIPKVHETVYAMKDEVVKDGDTADYVCETCYDDVKTYMGADLVPCGCNHTVN